MVQNYQSKPTLILHKIILYKIEIGNKVTATGHQLNPGDVIYIAQGSSSTIPAAHYTIFETPDANTFTTTPALSGTGDATLYPSIFFAERFTNGPYAIQNNGDQIKVTLNVSLD